MARFGLKFKKTQSAGMGGFHADYIDKKVKSRQRQSLGLVRALFSGTSLALGGIMFYVSLHYLPALIQPQKILAHSAVDTSASRLKDPNPLQKLVGPYVDAFRIKRTYLRAGQTIQAQYVLPEGASVDLSIQQCKRLWVIEVFSCTAVSQENITISNETLGTKAFRFPESGFYFFKETVTLPDSGGDYRVIWSRK